MLIYLYANHPSEAKWQLLINKYGRISLNLYNDCKVFIEYSNDMDDIYKDVGECNPNIERKILIVFDDMTADILSNKTLQQTVIELFIRSRKLNISLVSIIQSYFPVPKNIRVNFTYYFIMKFSNNQQDQQIAFNHPSDTDFEDFLNLYNKCTAKLYYFLLNDTTLGLDIFYVSETVFQEKKTIRDN